MSFLRLQIPMRWKFVTLSEKGPFAWESPDILVLLWTRHGTGSGRIRVGGLGYVHNLSPSLYEFRITLLGTYVRWGVGTYGRYTFRQTVSTNGHPRSPRTDWAYSPRDRWGFRRIITTRQQLLPKETGHKYFSIPPQILTIWSLSWGHRLVRWFPIDQIFFCCVQMCSFYWCDKIFEQMSI